MNLPPESGEFLLAKVHCPSCGLSYEVADSVMARPGAKLRCSSCRSVWQVFAAGTEADESVEAGEEESYSFGSSEDVQEPQRLRKRQFWDIFARKTGSESLARAFKYGVGALVFAAVAFGFVLFERIENFLDAGADLAWEKKYGKYPFDFVDLTSSLRETPQQGLELSVEGKIRNLSNVSLPTPGLRIELFSAEEELLQAWMVDAPQDALEAGMTLSFEHRLLSERARTGARVKVTFAPVNVRRKEARPKGAP